MKRSITLATVTLLTACASPPATETSGVRELHGTSLFVRTFGAGDPLLVVHGGPALDHRYFLPGLEALGASPDRWDDLPRLEMPTLLISGPADPVPPEMLDAMNTALPNSRVTVLPRTGHFPFLEAPEDYHLAIRAFHRAVPHVR